MKWFQNKSNLQPSDVPFNERLDKLRLTLHQLTFLTLNHLLHQQLHLVCGSLSAISGVKIVPCTVTCYRVGCDLAILVPL